MSFKFKHFKNLILIIFFFILLNCQLQEPSKNHGIIFLENRSKKLELTKSNKNDVIRIIGTPHAKSIANDDQWIYIERVITRGRYHKLGQNVLKTNNILILSFDKYGVLKEKDLLNKDDLKKIAFSKEFTENDLSRKSFIQSFLASIKAKMYGNK